MLVVSTNMHSLPQEDSHMTEEQMERKMEFIVETLARVAISQEKHELSQETHDLRLSRLELIARLMV